MTIEPLLFGKSDSNIYVPKDSNETTRVRKRSSNHKSRIATTIGQIPEINTAIEGEAMYDIQCAESV